MGNVETITYTLTDELGNSGQQLEFDQGDTKSITVAWFAADGSPLPLPTISAVVAKIFMGMNQPSLQKTLEASQITLVGAGPYTGCVIALAAADTASLPTSPQVSITLVITTNSKILQIDLPQALIAKTPLVTT